MNLEVTSYDISNQHIEESITYTRTPQEIKNTCLMFYNNLPEGLGNKN